MIPLLSFCASSGSHRAGRARVTVALAQRAAAGWPGGRPCVAGGADRWGGPSAGARGLGGWCAARCSSRLCLCLASSRPCPKCGRPRYSLRSSARRSNCSTVSIDHAAATITPTPKPSTDLSMQQLSDSIDKSAFSLRRVLKGGDRVQLKMARLLRDDEGGRCILLVRSKLKKADGSLVDYTFTVNRWMKIIYDSQNGKGRYIDYKHICVEDTESVGELFRSFNVVEINRVWRVDIHRDRRPPCFIGSVQEDEKQNT